jgi:hypothetical protein
VTEYEIDASIDSHCTFKNGELKDVTISVKTMEDEGKTFYRVAVVINAQIIESEDFVNIKKANDKSLAFKLKYIKG